MKLFQLFESKELFTEFRWYLEYIAEYSLDVHAELEKDNIVIYHEGKKIAQWNSGEAKAFRTNILSDSATCYSYSGSTVKNRVNKRILLEPIIAKDSYYSYNYAKGTIKGRFELGEPAIATDSDWARLYASEVIKKRFELGEPIISTDISSAYDYAKDVIKGRFKLGEPIISGNEDYFKAYQRMLEHS